MSDVNILVVEDETIIAMEIRDRLIKLGYTVSSVISSGEEVAQKVEELRPDLVLMDIMLGGKMDGVEAANEVRERFDIPVVYLTAYSDNNTLQRAKITEPYGYVLKPFDERELLTAIEIALYKHKMERKLKENERRFMTTLKSIGDAVITTDTKALVTFMNPIAEQLTGWTQEEVLGKDLIHVFNIINENTRMKVDSPVTKALKDGVIVGLANHSLLITRNSSEIAIDDSAAPIRDDKNRITGVVLVFRDITERKKLEEQLRQVHKLKAIGTLAGGVAHDFNNLLTAIRGCADMALLKVDPSDPLYQDLKEIQVSAEHAADLTRQLLCFSRNQPMRFTSLNLNGAIENLLKMIHRLIGEDIGISTVLMPGLWPIQADSGTIEQVIMNLVVNARDAMSKGGKLTLKTDNVEIDKTYCESIPEAQPGRYVRFSVMDTGIGMDKTTVERIFEPFFSTKKPGKGTGLGLSVVYGIVKQHNGWINVYSEINQGTTFNIYFPTAEAEPQQVGAKEISQKAPNGKGERILVVEDEKRVRDFVARALKKNGYIAFITVNADQAMEVWKKENGNFDLLFSDVVLPGKSGVELAEILLSLNPSLHVLLSSGYPNHKFQWSMIQEKGYQFLQKPYSLTSLLRSIREAL